MIEMGKVTATGLYLRAKPNANSEILAMLPQDTIVQIDGREGNWLRASYDLKRGYLYKTYVEVLSIPDPEPSSRRTYLMWALIAVLVLAGAVLIGTGWRP